MLNNEHFICIYSSALDKASNTKIAIKKITPMATSESDAKHTLREIRLMRYLGVHRNIIGLKDLYCPKGLDEIYIGMHLMDTDLHRIIQSPQKLTDAHLKHVGLIHVHVITQN
jgi:serine/threonine protein kinase